MIEEAKMEIESEELSLKLLNLWVRQRQKRQDLEMPSNERELKELGIKNFVNQIVEPQQSEHKQLKEVAKKISMADKVALLVMQQIPMLENSALLHKLSMQLAEDSQAPYFSKVNQQSNCGCGCGCGCAAMAKLPYEEKIYAHYAAKPFSIDPFNELGVSDKERDSLLIKDFLRSYEKISGSVKKLNERYFNMGREFG